MSQVSVVIPSHGRGAQIARTIAPLLADEATLEVIVVADADPLVANAARGMGDARVRVVPVTVRHQNAARQIGVEHARAETVLLLDDDVVAAAGMVSGHARHHPTDGLIVFGYMPTPADRQRGVRQFPARFYSHNYEGRVGWWLDRPNLALQAYWGGNVSLTRADALRVGLHNPAFPARYFEDYEFGARCDAAGLVARFDASIRATHMYERSIGEWLVEGRRQGAALTLLEPGKQFGSERLVPGLRPALLAATLAAGALRAERVERRMAHALRKIEMRRGADAVRDGTAVSLGLLAPTPTGPIKQSVQGVPPSASQMRASPPVPAGSGDGAE